MYRVRLSLDRGEVIYSDNVDESMEEGLSKFDTIIENEQGYIYFYRQGALFMMTLDSLNRRGGYIELIPVGD